MSKRKKFLIVGASIAALAAGGAGVAAATGTIGGDDENEGSEKPITGSALDQAEAAALAHIGEGTVTETEVGDEESYYEVEVTLDDGSQVDVQLDRGFNVVGDEADDDSSEDAADED